MTDRLPTARASSEVADFLAKLRGTLPAPANQSARGHHRLIFALDATASRGPTWDRAAHITHEMFEATAAFGGLDLQLVYYRDYDECWASPWVSTAAALHRLMRQVTCIAGNTQIERVLRHALRETDRQPIGAVVFVGDTIEEAPDLLCHLAGELGEKKVPIFVFHEGTDPAATVTFQRIAARSGGVYVPFDLAAADRLKNLLGAVAVYATGGHRALMAYSKKHGDKALLQLTSELPPDTRR